MVKIRKYANGIERFLHGQKGQRFFNFAYSIGAAIVIWGALFKILHLPGGSTLLCIGMGTEIAMFILTAFDRPPKEYAWEEVFPVLDSHNPEDRPDMAGGGQGGTVIVNGRPVEISGDSDEYYQGDGSEYAGSGGGFAAGGGVPAVISETAGLGLTEEETGSLRESISKLAAASEQIAQMAELADVTRSYVESMGGIAEQMTTLKQTTAALNQVSGVLLDSYRAITENSESVTASSAGYVERLEDLNRNIGGLNTIYEIQLKSISSQLESIDRVNRGLKDIRDMYEKSAAESSRYCEETEKMARYMKQLNAVYEKMITAMTINMYNPMMGGARPDQPAKDEQNPFSHPEA